MYNPISSWFVFSFACVSLSAQWLSYPTPGIPRTADGKPNLTAPAPKMADGKPDLSGIWAVVRTGERAGRPLYDISTLVQGGLPLRPEAAELAAKRAPVDSKLRTTEPKVNCLPQGPVLDDYDGWNRLVQTPNLIMMLMDYNKSYRLFYLDGRPLEADPEPTWDGYSVGH